MKTIRLAHAITVTALGVGWLLFATSIHAADESSNSAQDRLRAAQRALKLADTALGKATTASKGGYVENALADIEQAQAEITAALEYIKAHPEADDLSRFIVLPPESLPRTVTIPASDLRPNGTYQTPNVADAITTLNTALEALINGEGVRTGPPLHMAALGGYRDKIFQSVNLAASDAVAAINFSHGDLTTRAERRPKPLPVEEEKPAGGIQPWTNTDNQTIQAEQIGYDALKASVKLRLPNGTVYDYPLSKLAPADATRAKAWKPTAPAPAVPPANTAQIPD